MVSRYIKALAMTIVVLIIGLSAINFLDQSRIGSIENSVDEAALDLEASQQLFLYDSLFDEQDICIVINKRIEMQKSEAGEILERMSDVQATSLFGKNIELLKKKFILQNIELYILIEKSIQGCGSGEVVPVLYFYPDKYYCSDCASQAKILDSLVEKCENVRVFAFPTDLDIPVIDLLVAKYKISSYPSLVVKNQKLEGIIGETTLTSITGCKDP